MSKPTDPPGKKGRHRNHVHEKVELLQPYTNANFTFHAHDDCVSHNHDGDPGADVKAAIIRDAKEEARKHPFDSAGEIIDRIFNEKYRKILPHQGIDPKNLARAINREREQQLPRIDLVDINYEVKLDKLKGKSLAQALL